MFYSSKRGQKSSGRGTPLGSSSKRNDLTLAKKRKWITPRKREAKRGVKK